MGDGMDINIEQLEIAKEKYHVVPLVEHSHIRCALTSIWQSMRLLIELYSELAVHAMVIRRGWEPAKKEMNGQAAGF